MEREGSSGSRKRQRSSASKHRRRRSISTSNRTPLAASRQTGRSIRRSRTGSIDNAGFDVKYGITQSLTSRLHLSHGLRTGRRRRPAGQSHTLQPPLPGEARFLPRGPGNVCVWRCDDDSTHRRGDVSAGQYAGALLQPPHRTERKSCRPDRSRRQVDRQGGPIQHRIARHPDR